MCKNRLLVLLIVITIMVSSLCGCTINEKELSGEEIFEKLSVSTVEVAAESEYVSSLGTGFFIDENGTVVTNYHVIEDCSSANVTTSDGGTYKVTNVLGYDENLDAISGYIDFDTNRRLRCHYDNVRIDASFEQKNGYWRPIAHSRRI